MDYCDFTDFPVDFCVHCRVTWSEYLELIDTVEAVPA